VQAGEQLVRVNQDTRLNFRVLDLRTPANQGIFRIQSQVGNVKPIISNVILTSILLFFFES
jgi:aspartyl-tRNA synthetase